MKKTLILLVFAFIANFSNAQMEQLGNKIILDGIPIRLSEAENISLESSMEAYNAFHKAKRIRGWNILWAGLAGWEIGAGAVNVAYGYSVGFIDLGIGAGLMIIVGARESKSKMMIRSGVKSYNSAILKKKEEKERIEKEREERKRVKKEKAEEERVEKKQELNNGNQKIIYNQSKTERLLDLKKLLDANVLTKEEFQKEKEKILNE